MTRRLTTPDGIVSLLRDLNIRIVQTTLDDGVKGVARKYQDGYIVLLEESLGFDALLNALKHELYHIVNGDLDRDDPVEDIESENPY